VVERTRTLILSRTYDHCPYCAAKLGPSRVVCASCSDLPNLDPQFSNPRVVQAPVGVQVFAAGDSQ
jgi:hypothetical protein